MVIANGKVAGPHFFADLDQRGPHLPVKILNIQ